MRTHHWWLAIAIAIAPIPIVSATAHADEKGEKGEKGEHGKTVKLDEIPAPARQALLKEAAGSPIIRVEEEHQKDQVLYEGEVKKGNDLIGILVDANGKLINKHSEKDEHEHHDQKQK